MHVYAELYRRHAMTPSTRCAHPTHTPRTRRAHATHTARTRHAHAMHTACTSHAGHAMHAHDTADTNTGRKAAHVAGGAWRSLEELRRAGGRAGRPGAGPAMRAHMALGQRMQRLARRTNRWAETAGRLLASILAVRAALAVAVAVGRSGCTAWGCGFRDHETLRPWCISTGQSGVP